MTIDSKTPSKSLSALSTFSALFAFLAVFAFSASTVPAPAFADEDAEVTGISVSSAPTLGDTYRVGEKIRVTVTFDRAVDVNPVNSRGGLCLTCLAIDMDPAAWWGTKWIHYESGSGTDTLTFAYTVANPNFSSAGIAVEGSSVHLNGDRLSHTGLGHDAAHKVNWELAAADTAQVTGMSVTSSPLASATYSLGEKIRITVNFSEAVTVTGTPTLGIDMDPAWWGSKRATYEGGSGTDTLTFVHTVTDPNISTQGIAVTRNSLRLDGGTITGTDGGEDAGLKHAGLAHDANHKVDWSIPSMATFVPAQTRSPQTAASTSIESSAPSGLPALNAGVTSMNVNLNTMGIWGHPAYHEWNQSTNRGVDLVVKQRLVSSWRTTHRIDREQACGYFIDGSKCAQLTGVAYNASPPVWRYCTPPGQPNNVGGCAAFGALAGDVCAQGSRPDNPHCAGVGDLYESWFTYPHDAGTNDLKVHTRVKMLEVEDKINLQEYLKDTSVAWTNWFFDWQDFFTVEAHLEAPGSFVEPTEANSGTLTTMNSTTKRASWTGKAIAHANNPRDIWGRGDLIGGDAEIRVLFTTVGVSTTARAGLLLTNMKSAWRYTQDSNGNVPVSYPDYTSGVISFSDGGFSSDSSGVAGASVSGTFRDQNRDGNTNTTIPDTVGGVFDVPNRYKGGFVAHLP